MSRLCKLKVKIRWKIKTSEKLYFKNNLKVK